MNKPLFLLLFFFQISLLASAQCGSPQILNWHFTNDENVNIVFDAPEGTLSYKLTLITLYNDGMMYTEEFPEFDITGEALVGINSISVNPIPALGNNIFPSNYFYGAKLSVFCADSIESSANQFYISPYSLLNDPGYACNGLYFKPLMPLPDMAGATYSTTMVVPPGDVAEIIESLTVLVDVGHSYNGDLSITLESPAGTTITLLNFPNGLGGSSGMSILFQDGEPPVSTPLGVYSPDEPLSSFAGEFAHGVWTLTVTDNLAIDHGAIFGICLGVNSSPCLATIEGKAYYDQNENNFYDEGEPVLNNALISNSISGSTFYTNSNGNFSRCTPIGTGEITITSPPAYYIPVPSEHVITIAEGQTVTGLNFGLQAIPGINDLEVTLWSVFPDRPGFSNEYFVTYNNIGTECIANAQVSVSLDGLLTIDAVSVPGATFSENTALVNLGELCPLDQGQFTITHTLPDSVALGTELISFATINPTDGDANPVNNISTLNSTVVGSYDPNDKQVNHTVIGPAFLQQGLELTYLIRFQNTGTFMAERVVIIDTLDNDLDISTFTLLGFSHPVVVSHIGNKYFFTFDDIFLPDSISDEPGSHGYIRFSVKPYPTFSAGGSIDNTSYIYFDFNEAIVTNTVSTVLDITSGVSERYDLVPSVFPNPAKDVLYVSWPEEALLDQFEIMDITGRLVSRGRFSQNVSPAAIDLSKIPNGSYVLRLLGQSRVKPILFIKN